MRECSIDVEFCVLHEGPTAGETGDTIVDRASGVVAGELTRGLAITKRPSVEASASIVIVLPSVTVGGVAGVVGSKRELRARFARQACHKRNKRKQSKREEPLADRMSTQQSERVGTHFACGCFRQ